MINSESINKLLSELFRKEYIKMTAILCRHFSLQYIEIAEDIVSETFLKASEIWPANGLPKNPTAWLYNVSKNQAKDYFKHKSVVETHIKSSIILNDFEFEQHLELYDQIISDSQLALIFKVCNAVNTHESQICLALQILCGFKVEEIANALLTKPETIKKRLLRAKARLRNNNFKIKILNEAEIKSGLETVLKTLYLVFNEGYFSKTNNQKIRKDLCLEALRLTLLLKDNIYTDTPQTNALLSLMCYQSSRLEARNDLSGETVLFDKQNKDLWDKTLMEKGNFFLVEACSYNEISKYHLEAGIAFWHTTEDKNRWRYILKLYNQMLLIEYSPMIALSRTFAFSKVYGCKKAMTEAKKLNLQGFYYYDELLGYLNNHDT